MQESAGGALADRGRAEVLNPTGIDHCKPATTASSVIGWLVHQVVFAGSEGTAEPATLALGDARLTSERDTAARAQSNTPLDELLPPESLLEDTFQYDPDIQDMAMLSTADKQPSQGQTEPVDPFPPSVSALPASMSPQSSTLAQNSVDAASLSRNGEGIKLLDADAATVLNLPSGSEAKSGLPAAVPDMMTAAQANQGAAQRFSDVHEAASTGSSALSVDSDDFAENTTVITTDLHPPNNFSQPQRSSSDVMSSNAHSVNQAPDHSATVGDHQHLLEQETGQHPTSDSPESSASTHTSMALGLVLEGAQAVPLQEPMPADATQSHPDIALSPPASETRDQDTTPADAVSEHSESTQQEQQQEQQQHPASQHEDDALIEVPKPEAMPKPPEAAMAQAEKAERRLLTGDAVCGLTTAVNLYNAGTAEIYSAQWLLVLCMVGASSALNTGSCFCMFFS